jgi:hypothetical protein
VLERRQLLSRGVVPWAMQAAARLTRACLAMTPRLSSCSRLRKLPQDAPANRKTCAVATSSAGHLVDRDSKGQKDGVTLLPHQVRGFAPAKRIRSPTTRLATPAVRRAKREARTLLRRRDARPRHAGGGIRAGETDPLANDASRNPRRTPRQT